MLMQRFFSFQNDNGPYYIFKFRLDGQMHSSKTTNHSTLNYHLIDKLRMLCAVDVDVGSA